MTVDYVKRRWVDGWICKHSNKGERLPNAMNKGGWHAVAVGLCLLAVELSSSTCIKVPDVLHAIRRLGREISNDEGSSQPGSASANDDERACGDPVARLASCSRVALMFFAPLCLARARWLLHYLLHVSNSLGCRFIVVFNSLGRLRRRSIPVSPGSRD